MRNISRDEIAFEKSSIYETSNVKTLFKPVTNIVLHFEKKNLKIASKKITKNVSEKT